MVERKRTGQDEYYYPLVADASARRRVPLQACTTVRSVDRGGES
jgi:hypothetical protein